VTTLHERIAAELTQQLAVANAATEATSKLTGWINWPGGSQRQIGLCFDDRDDPAAIVYLERPQAEAFLVVLGLGDPADALRRYAGELEVLERHFPAADQPGQCRWCYAGGQDEYLPWPCPEIRSLASRLGVSVDE
jgi:hypothetical protein